MNLNGTAGTGPIQLQNSVTNNVLEASNSLSDDAEVSPSQAQLKQKMNKFTISASHKLLFFKLALEYEAHRATNCGKDKVFQ